MKAGDVLDVKISDGISRLFLKQTKILIAEINDGKINKKINFTLANKGEILVIFVNLIKGTKSPKIAAQFLIKSSLPVFPEETANSELKPFIRSGEIPQDEDETHENEPSEPNDETVGREEIDPLAGLTIVNKEDLTATPLEEE